MLLAGKKVQAGLYPDKSALISSVCRIVVALTPPLSGMPTAEASRETQAAGDEPSKDHHAIQAPTNTQFTRKTWRTTFLAVLVQSSVD